MKFFILVAAVCGLFWGFVEPEVELSEGKRVLDEDNRRTVGQLTDGESWYLIQPGEVSQYQSGAGAHVCFICAPACINDFFAGRSVSPLGDFFSAPDGGPGLLKTSRERWKIPPRVHFQRASEIVGLAPDQKTKSITVCNGLAVMAFDED